MPHPATMAGNEVRQFLKYLAIERRVAAVTKQQVLDAITFLYRLVLDQPLGEVGNFSRAKRPLRLSLQEGKINNQTEIQIALPEAVHHRARSSWGLTHHGQIRPSDKT
ncbi:MAG TPA: hypothetical protein ENI10_21515 [Halomonas sp.]|nr:hypothetical protein [Halomonas sp.]HEB07126.1 hypothetical protein [Halomonas sp.]